MADLSDYQQVLTPNYGVPSTVIVKGQGCRLYGQNGESYLDLAGGIAVSALGHCHPDVVKTLTEQANQVWHLSNVLANEPAIHLAKALVDATFAERVFFCNSGAEANEAAIKAARKATNNLFGNEKYEIICFDESFHGRTIATIAAGGQPKYREGFGPMPEGFTHIPINRGDILERAVSEKTCAIIVEPIQGEGGVRPICLKLFEKMRKHCDRVGAALIVDEVQTGMGRTGKLFAYQHSGITPDILTSAKSLGCGFPIGAMLCKEWISEHFVPGTHGSTYGGNPLGTAVARKALETINQPELLNNVLSRGEQLMQGLNELNERYELFQTIRGKGLLIGAVLKNDYAGRSGELTTLTMQEGLMTLIAGPDVHRFAPPLIISESEINDALTILARAYSHFIKQT
tara:strand:- start:25 stop:1230 length:1206 start_codon:yes stop_codon:yes gene_type:complete